MGRCAISSQDARKGSLAELKSKRDVIAGELDIECRLPQYRPGDGSKNENETPSVQSSMSMSKETIRTDTGPLFLLRRHLLKLLEQQLVLKCRTYILRAMPS
jgi:hypothetical protein